MRTERRSQGATTKAYSWYFEEEQRGQRRSGPPKLAAAAGEAEQQSKSDQDDERQTGRPRVAHAATTVVLVAGDSAVRFSQFTVELNRSPSKYNTAGHSTGTTGKVFAHSDDFAVWFGTSSCPEITGTHGARGRSCGLHIV